MKNKTFICKRTKVKFIVYEDSTITKLDGTLINKSKDKDGYNYIGLKGNKSRRNLRVCRLVASAFIPNPENKPQVNHKDGIKDNDIKSNLEWNTHSENMKHAVITGLHTNSSLKGENHNTSVISFEKVKQLRQDYNNNKGSMRKLAKEYNISVGLVSDIINNKCRTEC
jgi:hypothetical protein